MLNHYIDRMQTFSVRPLTYILYMKITPTYQIDWIPIATSYNICISSPVYRKVLEFHEKSLISLGTIELLQLLLNEETDGKVPLKKSLIIERAAKQLKRRQERHQFRYPEIHLLCSSSEKYERISPVLVFAMTSRNNIILPSKFRSQLFLCINRNVYSVDDVKQSVEVN